MKKIFSQLVLFSWLWCLIINPGIILTDTVVRFNSAHALWTKTEEIKIDPNYKHWVHGDEKLGILGKGNKRYQGYDLGQSLLMIPGDWIGTNLHRFFPKIDPYLLRQLSVNFFVFVPLNVLVVLSCFGLLVLFGFKEKVAALSSIIFMFGTTFLHYAQINQQNNQILLLVLLGYLAALAFVLKNRYFYAFLSGFALGGAVLVRLSSGIHSFTVLIFLVGCLAYKCRDKTIMLKAVGLWIIGHLPLVLIGNFFDYLQLGNFWAFRALQFFQAFRLDPAYSHFLSLPANFPFNNQWYIGILGVLFSPAKSLFIYDPLLLPSLILAVLLWRKFSFYIKCYIIANIINLLLFIVSTCKFFDWSGDSSWGARYHVTSVQLLLIPLIGMIVQYTQEIRVRKKLASFLIMAILIVAVTVQLSSVAMKYNFEIHQKLYGYPGTKNDFRLAERFINISCVLFGPYCKHCVASHPEIVLRAREDVKGGILGFESGNHIYLLPFILSKESLKNPDFKNTYNFLIRFWLAVFGLAIIFTIRFLRLLLSE